KRRSRRQVFRQGIGPRGRTDRTGRCDSPCDRESALDHQPISSWSLEEGRAAHERFSDQRAKEIRSEGRAQTVPVLETVTTGVKVTKREGSWPSLFCICSQRKKEYEKTRPQRGRARGVQQFLR